MRKVIVALTIIFAVLAAIAVMPSFTVNVFGKSITWPEIDYSKVFRSSEPIELSYQKGKEFDKYTSITFQVTSTTTADNQAGAAAVAEVMKQRLEIMEVVEPEIRYYKSADNYFIQVDVPGSTTEVQSYLNALRETGNVEFWKSIPQTDADNDGQPDTPPSYSDNPFLSGFQPTEINSEAFVSAKLNVNSTYGGYTIRVGVRKDAFIDQTQLASVSDNTWVAVASEYPIGAGRQVGMNDQAVMYEFIPQLGEGNKADALSLLAILGTKPYPIGVTVTTENPVESELPQNSLALLALAGVVSYIMVLLIAYIRAKEGFVFIKVSLFAFAVFTLLLFKLSVLNIKVTLTLLISFLIAFIVAARVLFYLVNKLEDTIKDVHPKNKIRLMDDFYKPFKKQANLILIFFLALLIILNMMHPGLYGQFVNGFGFPIVVMFLMTHTVVKPLLKTFYGMPIKINLNGAIQKFSKKQ
jgi:preprotein translocase subunit SecD